MAARRRFEFRETLDERFDIRFIRTGDDECWPWQAKLLTDAGYGIFWLSQTSQEVLAHRWAYERAFGPIPDGYDVDHTCHNNSGCEGGACDHRRCVNPGHLEAVPPLVNRQRSHLHTINRTHCPAGHPYDETNTYLTPRGGRRCKTCAALWKTADYVPDRAVNRARAEGHP